MVKVYSFWIFDKHCNCIYGFEYDSIKQKVHKVETDNHDMIAKSKILYGLVFSLTSLTTRYYYSNKITNESDDSLFPQKSNFRKITTGLYTVHTFKTETGLIFALLADLESGDSMDIELQYIYRQIYMNNVGLNPLAPLDYAETETEAKGKGFRQIKNDNFDKELYNFLEPLL
ncbi:hypothetical protein QEN19_004407 [Hanseniaspora menglaensis]